jgi:hypothetical protein
MAESAAAAVLSHVPLGSPPRLGKGAPLLPVDSRPLGSSPSRGDPARLAPSTSLLDSLVPAAGLTDDPSRLLATVHALSCAYRQLELDSAHLRSDVDRAREQQHAAEREASEASISAAEAVEEAGFLRHCLEQLRNGSGGGGGGGRG